MHESQQFELRIFYGESHEGIAWEKDVTADAASISRYVFLSKGSYYDRVSLEVLHSFLSKSAAWTRGILVHVMPLDSHFDPTAKYISYCPVLMLQMHEDWTLCSTVSTGCYT